MIYQYQITVLLLNYRRQTQQKLMSKLRLYLD